MQEKVSGNQNVIDENDEDDEFQQPKWSSSMKENESNRNLIDENDYAVYHFYRELSDAVTSYEIDTITKYNIKNKSKGFNEDTDLQSYLSTIRTEKDIQLFWHSNYKEDCTPVKFNGIPFAFLNKYI